MKKTLTLFTLCYFLTALSCFAQEEFIGPFSTWVNVKTAYNAKGDGTTDDTKALQNALDAMATYGSSNMKRWVYLPNGTYKITGTLKFNDKSGVNLVGEDPEKTIILWQGADGGGTAAMFLSMGSRDFTISRITFDGNNKNVIALSNDWNGTIGNYPGRIEFADLIMKNATDGLAVSKSNMASAENVVKRSKFINCSKGGISLYDGNNLNWWVWNCYFEDCGYACSSPGGGNYDVYYSIIKRSKNNDFECGGRNNFGLRWNYSIGSGKSFFYGSGSSVMQGNTVVDPAWNMASQTADAIVFFDNIFNYHSADTTSTLLRCWNGQIVSVGNTFPTLPHWESNARVSAFDDVVDKTTVKPVEPPAPVAPVNKNRVIYEVPAGANAAGVQAVIDKAVSSGNPGAVVYLAAGTYVLEKTLVIPANSDVQLVGDGFNYSATQLNWNGTDGQPALRLQAPSRATIRNIHILGKGGATTSDGILIEGADQVGGRVLMDQITLGENSGSGILVDKLDETIVEVRAHNSDGNIKVIGGSKAFAGAPGASVCRVIGTNSGYFDVKNNGNLVVMDLYSENGTATAVNLTSASRFTFSGGQWKTTVSPSPSNGIIVNSDNAKAALLGGAIQHLGFEIKGTGNNTKFLLAGTKSETNTNPMLKNTSTNARVVALNNINGQGAWTNTGTADKAFVLDMFKDLRNAKAFIYPLPTVASGKTDVKLSRISVYKSLNGINISGANSPTSIKNEYSKSVNGNIQLFPNPANSSTVLYYTVSQAGAVNIRVFDIMGKEVIQLVNEQQSAGDHQLNISTANLSDGIYLVKAFMSGNYLTQKLVVSK